MPLYRQSFVVQGTGIFPYDMLRYDECWPRYEKESPMLDSNQMLHDENYFKTPRRICICRYTADKKAQPTIGRWRSFGWTVDLDTLTTEKV